MPFTAKLRDTGERITITDDERMRSVHMGDLVCPFCERPMFQRGGGLTAVRLHFAHRAKCDTPWLPEDYRAGESDMHLMCKSWLAGNFQAFFPDRDCTNAQTDYEVILECAEQRRIADVMVTFADGAQVALEAQLASITPEKLEARTYDYETAGVDVVWCFGGSAATDTNRRWALQAFGVYFAFEIHERGYSTIRL